MQEINTINKYWKGHPKNGLIQICRDGYFGLMDMNSTILLEPKYDRIHPFYKGCAVVTLNGLYGVIDSTGKEVVSPKYEFISDFDNGAAWVFSKEQKQWGIIDKNGIFICPIQRQGITKYNNAGFFYDGKRLIRENGKIIFELDPNSFAGLPGERNTVNTAENQVRREQAVSYLENERNWNEANAIFYHKVPMDVLFYVQENRFIFPKPVDGIVKVGYKYSDGKTVIEPKFENAHHFLNNQACVKIDGKWGVIDNLGRFIIKPQYDYLEATTTNYFIFKDNEKFGVLDDKLKVIISPDFLAIKHLQGNLFGVLEPSEKINQKITIFNEESPHVSIDKWGVMNAESNEYILPCIYHEVQLVSNHLILGINFLFEDEVTSSLENHPTTGGAVTLNFKGRAQITFFTISGKKIETSTSDMVSFFDTQKGETIQILKIIPYKKVGNKGYKIGSDFFNEKWEKILEKNSLEAIQIESNHSRTKIFSDEKTKLKGCKNWAEEIIIKPIYDKLIIGNTGIIGQKQNQWILFDFSGNLLFQREADKMTEKYNGTIELLNGNKISTLNRTGSIIN